MRESRGLERLARACASVRLRVAVATVAVVVAGAAIAVLILSVLPASIREGRGSPAPLLIALVWALAAVAVLVVSRRTGRALDPMGLAHETDGAAGLGAGDVRAALEIHRARGSADLAGLHRERVSRHLEGLDADRLLPRTAPRWRRRATGAAAAGGVTLTALGLSALIRPQPTWSAVHALGAPWRTAFPAALPPLTLERQGAVRRAEPLAVRISAIGRARVTLAWRTAGEAVARREFVVAGDGSAAGSTGPITGVTRVWAEDVEGASRDTLTVRPVEPLLVQDLRVRVEYPAYLGRGHEEHRGQIPPLVAPEGTRLVISGETNLPLRGGTLTWAPPDGTADPGAGPSTRELDIDDTRFGTTLVPGRSGEWGWAFEADESLGDPILPDPLRVLVVPDLPPEIHLLFPGPDTLLGADRIMPLVVDVGDDIGLRDVVLRSWRSGRGEDRGERREVLAPRPDGSRRAVFRHLLDRSGTELLPGDTVFYRFEAFDGHPTRGPALSDIFLLRVPTFTEIRRERAEQTDDLSDSARDLDASVDALAEAAEAAARHAADPETSEGGFETTEEARSVLEDAERAKTELEDLGEELEGLRDELDRSVLDDEQLAAQLEKLAERYAELEDAGLLDRIEELAAALRDLDPEAVREALERLSEDSAWLRDQLEQTLGLLEQAALDQAMKSAQADASELADLQKELAETPAPEGSEWASDQERLADRAEALSDALQELESRLEEAGRETAADSAGAAVQRTEEAAGRMQEAAEDTRRASEPGGEPQAPTESSRAAAREAAAAMEQAAEALGSAQQGMAQEQRGAASEVLGRARAEALSLAGEEGLLADATSGREAQDPETWRARQGALRQGLDNLLERLSESGTEAAMLDQRTGAVAGDAARRMDELLERLAEDGARRLPARAEAESIQESLNELAVRLLAAEQAASSGQEQAQGQQAGEQMQSLAQQQQGVTQETSSLLTPGPRPVGRERRSEEVARRQEEIADRLDDLEDPGGELVGRPEEMASEARELARQLGADGPTQETLERQRRLFQRMLDAGRSLEDEDLDPNRRESRTGRTVPHEVPQIDPELLRGRRFPLPPEALLRELPVFYRPLIFQYFDRLNRAAPGGRGGSGSGGSGGDGGR